MRCIKHKDTTCVGGIFHWVLTDRSAGITDTVAGRTILSETDVLLYCYQRNNCDVLCAQ